MGYWWLLVIFLLMGCATDPQREREKKVSAYEEKMIEQAVDLSFFAEQLLQEANDALVVGDVYLAIDYTKRAGYYAPQSPEVWHRLTQLYLQQQHYKKAEASALRIIRFSKENTQLQAKGWRLIEQSRLLMGGNTRSQYAGHRAAKLESGDVFLKD